MNPRGLELTADCLAGIYADSKYSTVTEIEAALIDVGIMLVGSVTAEDISLCEPFKETKVLE